MRSRFVGIGAGPELFLAVADCRGGNTVKVLSHFTEKGESPLKTHTHARCAVPPAPSDAASADLKSDRKLR